MKLPDFKFETPLWKEGYTVIGIDEVGRGAFAGPVGVGGVVFEPNMSSKTRKYLLSLGINDSKKLTPQRRLTLSKVIKEVCSAYEICFIDVVTVNKIGVGKAAELGMINVSNHLAKNVQNPYLLIDAFKIKSKLPQKNIIFGDSLSISIAAASIIAKVERDALMEKFSESFPLYGFDKNKGYGTLYHRKAISRFGMSDIHRSGFCRNCFAESLPST